MSRPKHLFINLLHLWHRMEQFAIIIFFVFLAGLVISFIGFPQEVDETLEGCIITETGEQISCTVRLEGEVTHYIFRKGKYFMDDQLRVTVDGKFLVNITYDLGNEFYVFSNSRTVDAILRLSRDLFLAEFDIQMLFPEMESCRAILVAPGGYIEQIPLLLEDPNISENRTEPFRWVLE